MWEFLLQARTAQHAACGSVAHSTLHHPGLPLSKGMRDCLQCSLPAELDLIDSILNDTLQILSAFITGIITALPGVKWDFSNVYKYLMAVNEGSKTLLSGAPWEDKRQWAQIWKQEIHSEHGETHFRCEGCQTPEQVYTERFWSLHLWRYSKSNWTQVWEVHSRWTCLSRGVGLKNLKNTLPT